VIEEGSALRPTSAEAFRRLKRISSARRLKKSQNLREPTAVDTRLSGQTSCGPFPGLTTPKPNRWKQSFNGTLAAQFNPRTHVCRLFRHAATYLQARYAAACEYLYTSLALVTLAQPLEGDLRPGVTKDIGPFCLPRPAHEALELGR
jgi:hypothetical protein